VSWKPPITDFTVIPAKKGIHLYQWIMDSHLRFAAAGNDRFLGYRAFFSSLLVHSPLHDRRPFGGHTELDPENETGG
jgi:hypothetical protein